MSDEIIEKNSVLVQVLGQVSSQLRDSLGNIYNALEHVIPPEKRDGDQELDLNAAILCRSYYRVLRLTDNLSEVGRSEHLLSAAAAQRRRGGLL